MSRDDFISSCVTHKLHLHSRNTSQVAKVLLLLFMMVFPTSKGNFINYFLFETLRKRSSLFVFIFRYLRKVRKRKRSYKPSGWRKTCLHNIFHSLLHMKEKNGNRSDLTVCQCKFMQHVAILLDQNELERVCSL